MTCDPRPEHHVPQGWWREHDPITEVDRKEVELALRVHGPMRFRELVAEVEMTRGHCRRTIESLRSRGRVLAYKLPHPDRRYVTREGRVGYWKNDHRTRTFYMVAPSLMDMLMEREPEVQVFVTPWGRARSLSWDELRAVEAGRRSMTWAELCVMLRDELEMEHGPAEAMRLAVERTREKRKDQGHVNG